MVERKCCLCFRKAAYRREQPVDYIKELTSEQHDKENRPYYCVLHHMTQDVVLEEEET